MDLPSTYRFEGWSIRYSLIDSSKNALSNQKDVQYVAFVHGTPWSSIVFKPTVEALLAKRSCRILVYDLPGYGESQVFESSKTESGNTVEYTRDTSVKFQAKALTELLKHVAMDGKEGHSAPVILAHDIAGTIVLRSHLLHGCEFDSMILADTNTVLPWGDGFYKLVRSSPDAFERLPPKIFEAVVRAVIQSACYNAEVLKAGWEDKLALPWLAQGADDGTEGQSNFIRQIAQANDSDVAEMLADNLYEQVRCDVKLLWGERDQWIPKHKIDELANKLGNKLKEYDIIPDAGHLIMLDQPERFAIEVFDWLAGHASSLHSNRPPRP